MSATQDNAVVPESFSTSVMASSALFIGLALLMLGNGLQGSLLGVRASQEDFGSGVIGLIMAAFSRGFCSGQCGPPAPCDGWATSGCSLPWRPWHRWRFSSRSCSWCRWPGG